MRAEAFRILKIVAAMLVITVLWTLAILRTAEARTPSFQQTSIPVSKDIHHD